MQIDTSVSGNEITSEFVIDPASVEDAGSYECVAINRAGTDVDNVTVNGMSLYYYNVMMII